MLPSVLPRLTTDSVVVFGNFSPFKTPFLGWSFIPTSFVSYIFSYLFSKTMGYFSGCLMSSEFRSCFVAFTQCLKVLLMNL